MDQIDFRKNSFQQNMNQECNIQQFEQFHQKLKQDQQGQDDFNSQQGIINQKQRQMFLRQQSLNPFQENSIYSVQDQFKKTFFRKCRTISKYPSVISQQRSSSSNTSQIYNQNKEQSQKIKFSHGQDIDLDSIFNENRKEKISRIANKPEFFSENEWKNIPDDFEEEYYNSNGGNQPIKNNILASRLQSSARQQGNNNSLKSSFQQYNNRNSQNILNANLVNDSTQQIQLRYQNIINDNYRDKDKNDDKSIYQQQQLNNSCIQFIKEIKQRSKSEDTKKVKVTYTNNVTENLNQLYKYQKNMPEIFKNQKINSIFSSKYEQKTNNIKTKNFISKSLQDIGKQKIIQNNQNERFKTEPHLQILENINSQEQKNNIKIVNRQNATNKDKDEQSQGISLFEKINIIRRWIFLTFEDPSYSFFSKMICFFLQITIALSCLIFILNTVYLTSDTEQNLTDGINFNSNSDSTDSSNLSSQSTNDISQSVINYAIFSIYAEFIVSIIFTIDLFLRLVCCSSFGIPVKAYLKQPVNLIDLISIIPFYIVLIFQQTQVKQLYILRIVRLLRIIRVFKLSKYIKGFSILYKALQRSYKQLIFVLNLILIIALFASTLIYYLENHLTNSSLQLSDIDQSLKIESIPQSFWFTLATMSTVGYGDKIPNTILGKLVAMCIAFVGNALMIGLPIAIISYDFQVIYKEQKEMERFKSIKNKSIEQIKKLQNSAHASFKKFYSAQMTQENDNKEKSTNEQIQINQSFEISPQNNQNVKYKNRNQQNDIIQNSNFNQALNGSFLIDEMVNQKPEQIFNVNKQQQNYQQNKNDIQNYQNSQGTIQKQNIQNFQNTFLQSKKGEKSINNQNQTDSQYRIGDKQKIHFKRTVSQFDGQEQENIQKTEQNDEYEAQIIYMANRLKQISKTNKAIRELTFQISKMSYVVTLDIAKLYQTFSQEKKLQTNNQKERSDIAYMAQKCESTKNSLLKQRFNSIIAFQKSVNNNLSTKISLNQFMQLNQASFSKKGTLTLNSNSQVFQENRNPKSAKYFNSQKLSQNQNQVNQKFISESIPRSQHYYQKEKNFESSNFKQSFQEINDINAIKQNLMNQSNSQKNRSKSEFYRRFSEVNIQNKFSQQKAIYKLDEAEELSEKNNQCQFSDCQSENFADDELLEEEYGQVKLQNKYIQNLHFIKQLSQQSKSKSKEFKHKKNIQNEQNISNLNQNTSLIYSNSKKSKNSTKQDSQVKQSQNSEFNVEASIINNAQNIQKQFNNELNSSNLNCVNKQESLLNKNYLNKFNKKYDQMKNYLQKIDVFEDNNLTDQVSKVSHKISKKIEDDSLNDVQIDKMNIKKIPSQQQIHFRNNLNENENPQNLGQVEQRLYVQQGDNNQLSQQKNRKASQLQNIIQDLLLNVSLDIQEQEEQKSVHIKSIRNIENQQQFKNFIKGDFSKELYYKLPQSQFQ